MEVEWDVWVVAFLDLLGQKDAFLRADFLPKDDDQEGRARLNAALTDSLGAIETLHAILDAVQVGNRSIANESPDLGASQILELRWSDGIVLAASLVPKEGHDPSLALWRIFLTSAALSLRQLVVGKPIRGGMEVGLGVERGGQVFGPALVKAYELESKKAEWPRVVVGPTFVELLERTITMEAINPLDRFYCRRMRWMLCKEEDGLDMIDYAGQEFTSMAPELKIGQDCERALERAKESQKSFVAAGDLKLGARYEKLVQYLATREEFW